jgi:hypothetical protein
MNNIKKFLQEIKIYDTDLTKIRLGNCGDGGYVVLQELCHNTKKLITLGVGDDIGFEIDFLNKFNPENILLFDPIIEDIKEDNPKFTFFKHAFDWKHDSIKDIPNNSMLKIDIEWDEWETLLSFEANDIINKFSQIIVEFHIIHVQPRDRLSLYFNNLYQTVLDKINQNLFLEYYSVLKNLNENFYIFHVHANNSLPKIAIEEGVGHSRQRYLIPPLLEVSFVRKDLVDNVQESTTKSPVEGLDFPNKDDRTDLLNWYPME